MFLLSTRSIVQSNSVKVRQIAGRGFFGRIYQALFFVKSRGKTYDDISFPHWKNLARWRGGRLVPFTTVTNGYSWFSVSRHIKIKLVKTIICKGSPQDSGHSSFSYEDMRRNVLFIFIEICLETPCWCPSAWALTWRPETNTDICH